jgi:carbon monoxide dehydrogenase subunit G
VRLTNEFTVAARLEQTWSALLDVPRVARALPGARLEPGNGDGSWRGTMKVKLGPVTTEYEGSARLQDVDDDERVASFYVQGREARGQGTAAATITNRLSAAGDATRVAVETDLQVTGRQAQLGRGLMQDVAGVVLAEFSARLERELAAGPEPAEAAPAPIEDALDVGAVAGRALRERAALVGIGFAAGLVTGLLLRGRR